MSFWVYMLECADGSYYTGHTDNLDKRLAEHRQSAFKCYTASRLPVRLVFCSEFRTRDEAFAGERQIKGWTRRKKEALIREDWEKLVEYSKARGIHPSTSSG